MAEEDKKTEEVVNLGKSEPPVEFGVHTAFSPSLHGIVQNCQCLICKKWYAYGSIASHLKTAHKELHRKKGKTFEMFNENGTVKEGGGSRGRVSSRPKDTKCLVAGCGHICSRSAMWQHQRDAHNQSLELGVNYVKIEGVVTENPEPRKYANRQVLSPQGGYVDVEVTLRIPIVLGQVEIKGQ